VSAYALQQLLFDQLGRRSAEPGTALVVAGYDLTPAELDAVERNDIAGLFELGVHPVLLNAWCRATGHTRDQYRELLAPHRRPDDGKEPRWRTSA
jgi:hypothetical protein